MACCHQRSARRRHNLLRPGLSVVALAAGVLAAAPAAADTAVSDVVWLKPMTVDVAGNGSRYTTVEPSAGNIEGQIKVDLDAGVLGRVSNFDAWPLLHLGFKPGESETLGEAFKGTGMSKAKSYSSPRPKKVTETFLFSIPRARYQDFLVKACNHHADELRGAGHSDSDIFAQDRTIQVFATANMSYKMTGPDRVIFSDAPQQISGLESFDVICKRLPPRVPNPIAGASLLVRTAQLSTVTGACELRLHGTISSHEGNVQVKLRYVDAGGQQSDVKTVTTDAQGFANFTHTYPLSAEIKSGKIRMVGAGPTFQSDWAEFESECSAPPQDVATVLPPKAAALSFDVLEETAHRGLLCPSSISVEGLLEGRGKASGAVALFADGKLKKLQQYSIEDGHSLLVQGEHALTWGPTQAQQNVKLAMNVTNASAAIVGQLERSVNVTCRQMQASAAGAPDTRPAAGQLAAPQNLAIQAPQGMVRKGEIRLTGGASNGKYTLTFLRKNGGGYVVVNVAQLPKQMTGLAASFPLKALTGGPDWRLRVCPLHGSPNACATADFRLPRIGAGQRAQPAGPAPEQPQGTIFLVPGATN